MPYNSETETFYQALTTVVDSTPDGDTVQEGFDDRLTPAMAGLYADLNLLKADGMISVGIPATTTSRGIARVATLADMEPGAVIANGPAFLDAETVKITTTPTAHAVPQADEDGDVWGLAKQDLSNLNATGKAAITSMASPSNRYIDISLPSSGGTYKAPANGWLTFVGVADQTGKYLQLVCGKRSALMRAYAPGNAMSAEMKVQKNQVVTVNYDFSGYSLLTFTYDEGN